MSKSRVYLLNAIENDLPQADLERFWGNLQGVDLTTVTMIELSRAYLATVKG